MKKWFCIAAVCLCTQSYASEMIWYALRYKTADRMCTPEATISSLKKHYRKIDLLIPQGYSIDANGQVNKEIEPEMLAFARSHKLAVMPLVTNEQFSKEIAHTILLNENTQAKIINRLVDLCRQQHFYGVQMDFEMVAITDKDALSHFYEKVAAAMHQAGFKISYAVAPVVTEQPINLYYKKIYQNWEGAYDFQALGKTADFITIMAYNQHGGKTTPGPIASFPWTEQAVRYALQFIPANKISIGVPDYSIHWYTGKEIIIHQEKIAVRARAMNYQQAMQLVKLQHSPFIWNKQSALHYSIFETNWLYEYVFLEDAKSFNAKYKLVSKYHLRGISVFDLGTEDPELWKIMD